MLGIISNSEKNSPEALTSFREATKRNSQYLPAWINLALMEIPIDPNAAQYAAQKAVGLMKRVDDRKTFYKEFAKTCKESGAQSLENWIAVQAVKEVTRKITKTTVSTEENLCFWNNDSQNLDDAVRSKVNAGCPDSAYLTVPAERKITLNTREGNVPALKP